MNTRQKKSAKRVLQIGAILGSSLCWSNAQALTPSEFKAAQTKCDTVCNGQYGKSCREKPPVTNATETICRRLQDTCWIVNKCDEPCVGACPRVGRVVKT